MIKESYKQQVSLLLDILPIIAKEPQFAIHGGTAINLFEMDMPRLSVDIDLTFITFTEDREDDFSQIRRGLLNIKEGIKAALNGITFPDAKRADEELKLFCLRETSVVKIEVNQLNRGLIADARVLTLSTKAQEFFDTYCKVNAVSLGQLWGGKMNAALDRQHPRDLFDMHNFYQIHTITDEIKRGFLYFLLCSKRPIHEVLRPQPIDQRGVLLNQFIGMSDTPFSYEDYEQARQENIDSINKSLTDSDKEFLVSFLKGKPKWTENYNFSQYPPIRWKLMNQEKLKTMNPEKFDSQVKLLEKSLEQIENELTK
ncbi:MAG: nucleotidyl transferase AbiEii/AbiGii toxin family protein [Tannerella sp.]|jgi:hypothetical protein|nr:nucleotidyl transferase AbiEii/AbiGii toxin family protein [Tannerella sp.]